jgi:hypothetical protein
MLFEALRQDLTICCRMRPMMAISTPPPTPPPATLEMIEAASRPPPVAAPATSKLSNCPPIPPPRMPTIELPTGPRLILERCSSDVTPDRATDQLHNQTDDVDNASLLRSPWNTDSRECARSDQIDSCIGPTGVTGLTRHESSLRLASVPGPRRREIQLTRRSARASQHPPLISGC